MRHAALLGAARAISRLSISIVAKFRLVADTELPHPAIFIAPHRSMFDVPLGLQTFRLLGVAPLLVVSKSQLRSLRVPESNWDALDLMPIPRDGSGRSFLIAAGTEALANGRSVAIMPEGRIIRDSNGTEKMRSGGAELAVRANAPIVVLGSAGSEYFWQRGKPATFAKLKRRPVVVVVHEVIPPSEDFDATFERIVAGLTAAEAEARSRLHALTSA